MGDGPPVRWAFGAPAERLAWRRYWIRDTARGVSALVLHRLFGLLPVAAGSAIGLEGDSRQPSDLRRGVERLDPLVEALVLDRLDQWVMLPKLTS